jgi:hypothetical protein
MTNGLNPLCDVQKIIPIYQAAVYGLVDAWADTARVDHCATLLLRFWVQEIVALGAKVERSLWGKRYRKIPRAIDGSYHYDLFFSVL